MREITKPRENLLNKVFQKADELGLSINKLALVLGISPAYLSKMRNHKVNYSSKTELKLSKFLKYSATDIENIVEDKRPKGINEIKRQSFKKGYNRAINDVIKKFEEMKVDL
ncbi:helix-turn-helix domain-containing protein [Mammaliicoccus sciuri]|uniref:Helix-turn-helix domain-containing protein n=1 Tax=Mammaliicoccus sciuri TaxID=1296 RepID=A0AB37HK94_MAMSC|nr:helix-turn-helix domain-containing protein [Mammaliicoccus sciuri]QRN90279.1 helix-turn-helix domain-containing protein [Mammaliicoccus sciuri]